MKGPTGKWLKGWEVALWEPLPRAGPADLLDQLWTRTVLSQAQFRAWNELRLLCWGGSGSGWWQRDAAPPPMDRGWSQCWGQQQLYWVTFISLSVCPSEPEEPTDPGLACHPWFPDLCTDQWPYTFWGTVNISIVLTVLSLVSKKSPTKLKKPCS